MPTMTFRIIDANPEHSYVVIESTDAEHQETKKELRGEQFHGIMGCAAKITILDFFAYMIQRGMQEAVVFAKMDDSAKTPLAILRAEYKDIRGWQTLDCSPPEVRDVLYICLEVADLPRAPSRSMLDIPQTKTSAGARVVPENPYKHN